MIFVDTNVLSELLHKTPDIQVVQWLEKNDRDVAVSTMVLAEISYGIERIRLEQRAGRLQTRLDDWRQRFKGRIYGFDEECAFAFGMLMAQAERAGRRMQVPDAIIAAVALVNGGRLATRNVRDFETTGLDLISPWA